MQSARKEDQLDMIESWGDAPDFGLDDLCADDVPVIRPFAPISSRRYAITPVPKPRQTQSDRWKKRPCVVRYREYKDQINELGIDVPGTGSRMIFVMPMPKSWSNKKKAQMLGQPHKQKPDTDNMIKAVLDSVHKEDSQIYHVDGLKFWGNEGAIIIQEIQQALCLDGDHIVWKEM